MGYLSRNTNALILNFTARKGIYTYYRAADGGFAGSRLAYKRKGFALINVEGSVLYRFYRTVTLTEGNVHIFKGQEYFPAVLILGAVFGKMRDTSLFFLFLIYISHCTLRSYILNAFISFSWIL